MQVALSLWSTPDCYDGSKEQPASNPLRLALGSGADIVSRGLRLVQSAQAFGAQAHTFGPALHHHCHPLDVGLPLPFGTLLRLGDAVPKLRLFAAEITFGHVPPH